MSDESERRIPLIEERARVDKQVVERGVVRITTSVREREQLLAADVAHEEVNIERIPVNKEVKDRPQVREDGDVIVIPIVEERVVLVKHLVLVEELHVRRKTVQETVHVPVTVHATEVDVERHGANSGEHS
ncbi:MAG: YsnF/AvaK domain-containing protein [Povalibacter sp.]